MADVPFGLTFGNPNKYIGSSGVGPAIKAGLTAYGMQKSGLTDFLNNLNKKPSPDGSVPPLGGASGADMDVYSSGFGGMPPPEAVNPNANAFNEQAQNQVNLNKSMIPNASVVPGAVAPSAGVQVTPVPDNLPADIGHQILDGNDSWQHSAVNPQAERDSLVLPQQVGYNTPLQTGNEYQQVPGYGSAKKAAMAMFGMG